jgi:threonine/homoserine/homoserine lactone efflux protein
MLSDSAILMVSAAVLAMPGPTNALLAVAGCERSWVRSQPCALIVIATYAAAIQGWIHLLAMMEARGALLRLGFLLAVTVFLAASSILLWRAASRPSGESREQVVTGSRLFWTTLLNPKAIALALLLGQGRSGSIAPVLVVLVSLGTSQLWIIGGSALRRALAEGSRQRILTRGMALVYAGFAVVIATQSAAAAAHIWRSVS